MQDREKMQPEDIRNLIIFMALSVLLWLAYDQLILAPQKAQLEAYNKEQKSQIEQMASMQTDPAEQERPRAEIVSDTGRIKIETPNLTGSINPIGGRIDDISLKHYFHTLEKKEPVHLLSPAETPYPRYAEYGWVTKDSAVKVPDNKTRWSVRGNKTLTPETPVTLTWNNGQGLTFSKTITIDDQYGLTITQDVTNKTGREVTLFPYALITEHGLPEEYFNRYVVHEGPLGYMDSQLYERSYKNLSDKSLETVSATSGWIGITEKYWLAAIVPPQDENLLFRFAHRPSLIKSTDKEKNKDKYQTDVMGQGRAIASGETGNFTTHLFAGAKKLNILQSYENTWGVSHFDLALDFGWFYFLTYPFFIIINFFYGLVGNFGVAIILFTVCVRICIFPLANISFKSFAHLRRVTPKMYDLRDKYKDDKQKLQEELVKLYQTEKVNPMAGCFPILVQIPIFFSLYKVLNVTIEMRHAPFFGWIQDLSVPDPTSILNLFGLLPWEAPSFFHIGIWPCLMLLAMLAQKRLSPPPSDPMAARMVAFMPFFMTYVLSQFAAGLVVYWTFNNMLSVLQQYVIMRRMGVDVSFFKKSEGLGTMEDAPDIHPEAELVKEEVEEALFGKDEDSAPKEISKPKPKKSKKKK